MKKVILALLLILLSLKLIPENSKTTFTKEKEAIEIVEEVQQRNVSQSAKDLPIFSPVHTKDIFRISDVYGKRLVHPITKRPAFHNGIDFSVVVNTKVFATTNGIVEEAKRRPGYGKQIVINHKYNYSTRYAHLNKILINKGDSIIKGQLIGLSGNTGITTGPHLHYEVMISGHTIDPFLFYFDFPTPKYRKLYLEKLRKLEYYPI